MAITTGSWVVTNGKRSLKNITAGKQYHVKSVSLPNHKFIKLCNDTGKEANYAISLFEHSTLATTAAAAPTLSVMPFAKGDWFTINKPKKDMTVGKAYEVEHVMMTNYIRTTDDAGDRHDINIRTITMCQPPKKYQGAMGSGNRAKVHMTTQQRAYATKLQGLPPEVEEDTYEQTKAKQSVTSSGLFKAGDRLVYSDGTVTSEHRTVTRCTATCVWFEETYSMPFNPSEFNLEYSDE